MSEALTILHGDAREKLRELPDESVQCVVTSPPFWGLRKYNTPAQIWGGNQDCTHEWVEHLQPAANGIINPRGMTARTLSRNSATRRPKKSDFCARCGAWRGELGLEPTPHLYVDHLVDVFAELRRILKKDGTAWLNLGDTYATGAGSARSPGGRCFGKQNTIIEAGSFPSSQPNRNAIPGLKPKDLVGIPWRVAFALQEGGWTLRSDIIWNKRSCMPESVSDRCTRNHEYIFLLARSRSYFFDQDAIKEDSAYPTDNRKGRSYAHHKSRAVGERNGLNANYLSRGRGAYPKRNKRTVWSVTNAGYRGSHFATFPPALIEPCILAGSRPGDVVLDPFAGSGTTGMVALKHGRGAILIELNADYLKLIHERTAPLLAV